MREGRLDGFGFGSLAVYSAKTALTLKATTSATYMYVHKCTYDA